MNDRIIALEGVHNFRDFGGYHAGERGRVRRGRLYRSAHLAHATPEDCAIIDTLGITAIADLRREGERSAEPNAWPAPAVEAVAGARVIISDAGAADEPAPHLQFLKESKRLTPESVRAYMCSVYEELPFKERYVTLFRAVFEAARTEPGGVLVHCAAGKDRTGIICALVLDALGVAHEDIVTDYELTNTAADIEGIAEQAVERFTARIGRAVTSAEIRPLIGVSRDYLETTWRAIRAQSGSLAAYRRDVLGLTTADVDELRARLVEARGDDGG